MVYIIGQDRDRDPTYTKEQLLHDDKVQSAGIVGDSIQFLRRQKPLVKVGMYIGKFPVITPKDAVFLSLCRTKCDMLIVALQSDYSVRLKQEQSLVEHPAKERAFTIASLPFVDWVVLYDEEDPDLAVGTVSPDYVFHGLYSDDDQVLNSKREKLKRVTHPFPVTARPQKKIPLKFFDIATEE